MKKMLGLSLAGLVLSSISAGKSQAGWPYPGMWCEDHPEKVSTVLDQNIDAILGSCSWVPLKLERTQDGPLTVDAWTGGYDLVVSMTTTYRIDHYDRCSGNWLWSDSRKGTEQKTLSFDVINPNLAEGLPSYVSQAPMTDQEAQEALPEALQRCQSVRPGHYSR